MTIYTMRRPKRMRASAVANFPNEFVVLAGSEASALLKNNVHDSYERKRAGLIECGLLLPIKGSIHKLAFTQNVAFRNPSEAAVVVLGAPANGCLEWRDQAGNGPPRYPRGFHSKRASIAARLRELSIASYNCDDDSGRSFARTLSQLAEQLETGAIP